MRIRSKYITLFLTLFAILQIDALKGESLFLRSFIPDNAFLNPSVTCIAEDKEGFLIIGTKSSLYRFDGVQYMAIPFPDSLTSAEPVSLMSHENTIFAGLSNGVLLRFEHNNGTYVPRFISRFSSRITALMMHQNKLWVSTYGDGIFIQDQAGKVPSFHAVDGLPDAFIYDLEQGNNGFVWAGTDAGLVCIDPSEHEPVITVFDNLPDLIVQTICNDWQGNLWLGFHQGGLARFNTETNECISPLQNQLWNYGSVSQIVLHHSVPFFLTTLNGLMTLSNDFAQLISFENETTLTKEKIIQLSPSISGGFWIAGNKQLHYTLGRQINFYGTPYEDIRCLLADSRQQLWYCNQDALFCIDPLNMHKTIKPYFEGTPYKDYFITCLYEDFKGNIWMGTFDEGIIILDPQTKKLRHFTEKQGLANNNVLSITGNTNNIWLATLGGASAATIKADGTIAFESFDQEDGLGNNYIYQVFSDSKNRTWFATDGNGLSYYEQSQFYRVEMDTADNRVVYSITEDKDGKIWFAVADEGIYRLDENGFTAFSVADGLVSASVTAIVATGTEYLIVIGKEGIDFIHSQTGAVYPFSRMYSIKAIDPDLNAFSVQNGRYYLGSSNGIVALSEIQELATRFPSLYLNQVRVLMNPALNTEQIPLRLGYHENQLSFDYSGLWFANPAEIRFKHQLEGNEAQWVTTRDHTAGYSALKPGKYRFKLQIDEWIAQPEIVQQDFSFVITTPLWQKWWFIGLIILILGVFIAAFIKQREHKIEQEQQIRREKIEFEYRNLRNQVNPHFLFNSFSTLMALIETNQSASLTYVENLSDYFRHILQFRDTELIPLKEEMQLLQNYVSLQRERYGNALDLQIEIPEAQQQSLIPPMSLQMLVENALKHNIASKSQPLSISMYHESDHLYVKNPLQPKKNPDQSTGLGLKNIDDRYKHFAAKRIIIQQTATHFIVILPIINPS